jgi:hypothetical protein
LTDLAPQQIDRKNITRKQSEGGKQKNRGREGRNHPDSGIPAADEPREREAEML